MRETRKASNPATPKVVIKLRLLQNNSLSYDTSQHVAGFQEEQLLAVACAHTGTATASTMRARDHEL